MTVFDHLLGEHDFRSILTQGTLPSVIHGWKATDLLFQMVNMRIDFLNPISRQNFASAFAVTHNLKLEPRHKGRVQ